VQWRTHLATVQWRTHLATVQWRTHLATAQWRTHLATVQWRTHLATVQWRTHLATVQWRTHPATVQWRTFWVGCLEASDVIRDEPAHTGSPKHACFRFERCRVKQCSASRDAGSLGPHVPSGWVPLPS
jgi:hypothetical protein